jgi:eukaryotic-like serine/threonine-protein kinase
LTRRELGGRYRLEEEIGGGGMALVYRAVDTLLDRTVAIKMLRPQYVDDDQFVSRFRQEAQSAAKLSHPNIVNLYDVGVEDNEYYIVMEYVDGPTLKDIIIERAPLPVPQVVDITNQICAALEHAHEHHIIHRDIKPHNILLTKIGIVKVADFGIARAVTGDTITDFQATTVLGSVHYISPEQARGGTTDVKSDIYSLGIVMYEMLTNQLPFSGDSPVSVALKHLRDRFVEPRELNRKIPQSIENIVLKCLVKSPDMRYENMSAMRADLNDALIHPNVQKFSMPLEVADETISIPAIGIASASGREVRTGNKRKRPWWKTLLWWLVAMLLVLVGGFAAYYILMRFIQVPNENLPNVIGKSEQQAVSTLKAAGFQTSQIQEEKAVNSDKPAGIVYDQNPPGPTVVKKGRDITLYISLGAPKVSMPNVIGVVADQAIQTLVNQGFKRQNITEQQVQSADVPAGQVVSSSPVTGENVSTDAKLTLQVSSGATTQVPDVVGLAYKDAVSALQAANLQIGQVIKMPFSAQDQTVFKISPYSVGQSVPDGTSINLYVVDNSGAEGGNSNTTANNGTDTGNENGKPTGTEVRPVPIQVHVKHHTPIQVTILVSDARGSDQKVVEQTVTADSSWTINVYVSPETSGNIQVLENGNQTQNWNVAYQ